MESLAARRFALQNLQPGGDAEGNLPLYLKFLVLSNDANHVLGIRLREAYIEGFA
jgi:hypothetical protein